MKKISFLFSAILFTSIFFTACVKDRNTGPDFSSTAPVLELRTPISNIAGLANFSRAELSNFSTGISQFYVNLASANTFDHDVNVTIGVDPTLIDTYNADDNNTVKYVLMPDSVYTLSKTAGTIVKGQRIDSFQITFYKDKIDPAQNYMLPVTITDGDGVLISGNQATIWYHAIGNPYAGAYSDVGYFYHPSGPRDIAPNTKVMSAVSSSILQVDLGDLGGSGYIAWLTVDPVTNEVTILNYDSENYYGDPNFLIQWNSLAPTGYSPAWSGSDQCNNTYDPATKTFYLRYGYLGSGGYRVSEEILTKQ
jgi:hypothetical protein